MLNLRLANSKIKRSIIVLTLFLAMMFSICGVFAASYSETYDYTISGSTKAYIVPKANVTNGTCTSSSISGYTNDTVNYPKVSVNATPKLNDGGYYVKYDGTAYVYNYNQSSIVKYISGTWTVSK